MYRPNPPLRTLSEVLPGLGVDYGLADVIHGDLRGNQPPESIVYDDENLLFHVTSNIRKGYSNIDKEGIIGGKRPMWTGRYGQQLRDPGKIYVMEDFRDALLWAFKTNWDKKDHFKRKKLKVYIVVFEKDEIPWEHDTHPEGRNQEGRRWLKRYQSVSVDDIVEIIEYQDVPNPGFGGSRRNPDRKLRELERTYQTVASEENLYALNVYRVRHGLIELPSTYEQLSQLEQDMQRGALPIYRAALAEYYTEVVGPGPSSYDQPRDEADRRNRELRNAVYHLIGMVGRWGSVQDIQLLAEVAAFIEEHNTWTDSEGNIRQERPHITSRKAQEALTWLEIRDEYGFTDETTVWDVVIASPLIDEIVVAENARAVTNIYYERRLGYWQQEEGIPYYGGLYREGGFHPIWRSSVPGYGGGDRGISSSLFSTLRSILSAKYRGRLRGHREPLPREDWPEEIVFCTTQEAVNILSQTLLHVYEWSGGSGFSDPSRYNYLFRFEDNR
jgi:hypothetical protein